MSTATSKIKTRRIFLVFLLAALLIGGVVSFYASGHPDGLEYVARSTGFLDTAKPSAGAGSPLADYGVAGVRNLQLSRGVAGIIGVLVTLLLAGGLFWVLRRRTGSDSEA
jgi:cobalt/nickel transport protein